MDGNDYNPTDESFGEWDDEKFDFAENRTSIDVDNDTWYGYGNELKNDDWFYDYNDYDNDGLYAAMVSYSDWDLDGQYDDYNYYSFGDAGTDEQKEKARNEAADSSAPKIGRWQNPKHEICKGTRQ